MRSIACSTLLFCAVSSQPNRVQAREQIPENLPIVAENPGGRQSESGAAPREEMASWSDSVRERRHFDRRLLHVGAMHGFYSEVQLLGLFAEANVWDRLALGGTFGVSFWGPEAGAYARFRAITWGGEGMHLLNAFTLSPEYLVLRQGGEVFSFCDHDCRPTFLSRTAEAIAVSAGFEHQLESGWTIRYDFGWAHVLSGAPWRCELERAAAPCTGQPPSNDLFLASFAVGHAL